jgi:tRNA dimethylallyltransferase
MMRIPLVIVVGPTGVGKTAAAVQLASQVHGEIVSADSRQFYRHMDIGTAKPSLDERALAPHHLLDFLDPDTPFSLSEYKERAQAAIAGIAARGHVPMLVGGTGLYVRAVAEGWTLPEVPPDRELRERLEERAAREGGALLFAELQRLDPAAAAQIDPSNVRRVIRALEVCQVTGRPFSEQRRREPPPYDELWLGLTMPRAALYERVDARIDAMVAAGWVEEVRALLARGYSLDLPAFTALGYREIGAYLRGEVSLEAAVVAIKHHTHRFIRHQYAWFSLSDVRLHWFEAQRRILPAMVELVAQFLKERA